MIKSFVINNIKDEYTPENILFEQWLSAFDFVKNAEITIKIVTPKEMKSLNILYKN